MPALRYNGQASMTVAQRLNTMAYRQRWRSINMFERALLGPLAPLVPTPNDVVFMWDQSVLYEYDMPRSPRKYKTPIMIVPPLMVKPTIFDLRPGHSMVGHLCQQGHHVFMIDYGVPTDQDRHIRVDDYITDFIPSAVEKIKERTGAKDVSLVGWSMGGIMSYAYTAMQYKSAPVRNLITIGSPYDFSRMFPFNYLARGMKLPTTRALFDMIGNIPPALTRTGFKLLDPAKTLRRNLDLVLNYWDRNWVAAHESMSGWADDFIPYPGDAFVQFVSEFVMSDKLRRGELQIGGQTVDMSKFAANLMVVVGTTDKVAPPDSVEAAYELLPSPDKRVLRVALGHIGLVSGSKAPALVWQPVSDWLAERSEPLTPRGRSR